MRIKIYKQNDQMNKSKGSLSQTKMKPKLPILSPSNNKSPIKSRDKCERVSPRSNRIHTLEAKKTLEMPRKTNLVIRTEEPLRDIGKSTNEQTSGYETPKFKCEAPQSQTQKKMAASHNYFSFGEKEFENTASKKRVGQQRDRQKEVIHRPKTEKEAKVIRKQHLIR